MKIMSVPALAAVLCVSLLSGCVPRIEVATPKDPITINMNVKIEHEIHIKVDKDVENLLKPKAVCSRSRHEKTLFVAGRAAGLFSAVAMALTLDEAKQQGRVGETLSGYIAPVKQDAETLALVKRINAGRAESIRKWRTATTSPSTKWRAWPGRSW